MNEALEGLGSGGVAPRPARIAHLVFILDLTGSREPRLRHARKATAEMFEAVKKIGSVMLKLIYYRGCRELRSTDWESSADVVSRAMQKLSTCTGKTQIARALRVVMEKETEPFSGVVFIGGHCEDNPGELRELAGEFRRKGIPIYVFHECADGDDTALAAQPMFHHLATASRGVYSEFAPEKSSAVLRELLSTVAAFSAAGVEGVWQIGSAETPEAR